MQYTDFIIFLLVFVRIICFISTSPIFVIKGIPSLLKVGLAVLLSFLVFNFVGVDKSLIPDSNIALISAALAECIFGLALGFITTLVFNAIRMSGQLMDVQVGFAMASEFDVTGAGNVTLLGNLSYLTGLLIFFLINGHHVLIQCIVQSFDILPILGFSIPPEMGTFVLSLFIKMIVLGLKLAAPVIIVIFLTDFTMGLVARTVPQLNILMLGMPVKILVGLLVFTAIFPGLVNLYIKAFQSLPGDINNFLKLFPFVILFASSDKTEDPTQKKKDDARKKGQVAKSKEFISAVTLIGITMIAISFGDNGLKVAEDFLTRSLSIANKTYISEGDVINLFIYSFMEFLKITLPIFIGVMLLGVIANLIQTGFIISSEPMKPKFSRLNPIEGFKRMFSGKAVMEMLKACANIIVVGYIAYSFIQGELYKILKISDMGLGSLIAIPRDIIQSELVRVAIVVSIIGIIDFIFQKRQYKKELRMTKQEIKEEFKQMEGDPKVKSAIKQRQREMASKRMMHEVPSATVVVTNPTHFAVALRYKQGKDSAPMVVAKGADHIAQKIKQIAKESKVPIIENKPIARMLYEKIDINESVPVEMYQAVAEILAVVYSLNKKTRG